MQINSHLLTYAERLLSSETFTSDEREQFLTRFERCLPTATKLMQELYGTRGDFQNQLEEVIKLLVASLRERPIDLKKLDKEREDNPLWFRSERMIGGVCYVDRFAENLAGLHGKLSYLEELGLTYLHLMPLFLSPVENNDGGYAVSSFREVNPAIGTMEELRVLAQKLRQRGISLVMDFVFNHTSNEHEWAKKALAGNPVFQNYYRMFDDRTLPDAHEQHLREIFPEQAPGSFTYVSQIRKWVWTTFFTFQWDLNYENPELFRAMLGEMLFLANQGVEILRLDAVPFIWKQLGTNSENLPQAHIIIRAFNALSRIAAPSLLFKSEAIVHPRDVASYVDAEECQLSYNPIMMVGLWDALATQNVKLLKRSLENYLTIHAHCAWVNYVRSHDDIGWGFADEDALSEQINPENHRFFLSLFFTGRYPKSYARGVPFNFNQETLDMRVSGTTASLVGIEAALESANKQNLELAVRRLLLIQSVAISMQGIPLIYLGDEVATLNDYSYEDDAKLSIDSRWIHRPRRNWSDASSYGQEVLASTMKIIHVRKSNAAFSAGTIQLLTTEKPSVLAYLLNETVLVLANFSESSQLINLLDALSPQLTLGECRNLISDEKIKSPYTIELEPYGFCWISIH
jgi:amylosucrase